MSLLGTLATIGAMELPEAKTAISKTQDMKEAVLIAVGPKIIEGELRICLQDSIIYECGKCRWDEKNLTSNYSLLYQPHDPVVPITKCIVGTDNGIPRYLPYSLLADKKQNDIVRFFNDKENCCFELVCSGNNNWHNWQSFEECLKIKKQEFLNRAKLGAWCQGELLLKLKILAQEGTSISHGPYGFGKVPSSLKDACIKYIFLNKDKLTAEQRAQIKLLPEELREQIEPLAKDEQKT